MKLNEQIKELRKKANISQEELAETIPCDTKTISKYETGKLQISTDTLKRLGEILNFSVSMSPGGEYEIAEMKVYAPYITEKKLSEIEQDLDVKGKVIVRLIFEGIYGKMLSELIGLKKEQVDFQNKKVVLANNDQSDREIEISDRAITYLEELVGLNPDNEYIFVDKDGSPMSKTKFYMFLRKVGERNNFPETVAKFINRSGMLYMGKRLMNQSGQLREEHLELIEKRYNVKKIKTKDNQEKSIMHTIVNPEFIASIYK
ncbi:helix-turn-helix domain-containing protein (plasmid) [Rossellomorea sp. AcN35-11]|nr:helix-turn-helix domain-containing protein [Rossellomorea aquimaris]WJV32054.1 helix-turn-helix domain-containing protein [Rossellomorea sp. AcN35-11]